MVAFLLLVYSGLAPPIQRSDTVVVVAGPPVHSGLGRAVVELSIGNNPRSSPEYLFTAVLEIAVGRDGSIFVVDIPSPAQESINRVVQFDRNGTFVRQIGRRGQGPGEYIGPKGFRVLPNGVMALLDNANGRVNLYSPTGESVDTWLFRRPEDRSGATGLYADTAGFLYLNALATNSSGFNGLIRYGAGGGVIDSLPSADLHAGADPRLPQTILLRGEGVGSLFNAQIPFTPSLRWTWSPLGYWISGYPDRYAFELHLPVTARGRIAVPPRQGTAPRPVYRWRPGDPIRSIRRNVPAPVVAPAEREEQRTIFEARARRTVPDWGWDGAAIPRVKPSYRSLFAGDDGRIWVQLSTTATRVDLALGIQPPPRGPRSRGPIVPVQRWVEPNVFDIFEPDGRYVGQAELPHLAKLHAARGDTVWVSRTDRDDVPFIQRLRVVWP